MEKTFISDVMSKRVMESVARLRKSYDLIDKPDVPELGNKGKNLLRREIDDLLQEAHGDFLPNKSRTMQDIFRFRREPIDPGLN